MVTGLRRFVALVLCTFAITTPAVAQLLLGATTTTDNSGLLNYLLPRFSAATGVETRVVIQGSGAILRLAETGDIDVALVHDRAAEDRFMAAGFGAARHDLMESRFLLVGPRDDPAGIGGAPSLDAALQRIVAAGAGFISRGDESGTHTAELRLWRDAGLDPRTFDGGWYRETGSGMGATLNIAVALGAYTLTESATWASFGYRADLTSLIGGDDPRLVNPYGVIAVDPGRHDDIEIEAARALVAWLVGPAGQAAIAAFEVGGEHPFRPTAGADQEGG